MTFLNSTYGLKQIAKGVYGAAQPEIAPYYLERIWVPNASADLQGIVAGLVRKAREAAAQAVEGLREAEAALLNELGLSDWRAPEPLTYTGTAGAVATSGRLDAQHFTPAWPALRAMLATRASLTAIGDVATVNRRGIQPIFVENGDMPVIASQNITPDGISLETLQRCDSTKMAPPDLERVRVQSDDALIYTTGAYVGRAAPYIFTEPAIASNHVNILRLSNYDPVIASILLNSPIGREQTKIHARGSAQAELYPSDIALFELPEVTEATVTLTRRLYASGQMALDRTRTVLKVARRIVEMAIEVSEEDAIQLASDLNSAGTDGAVTA
jgi:hypothetical protein